MKKFRDRPWYSLTVSICIGVILFVALIRINSVLNGIRTFFGFFSTVFLGAVIAYIINPLAMLFRNKVFFKIKKDEKVFIFFDFAGDRHCHVCPERQHSA